MKKIFTLALVLAMAITSFAQVKSMSRKSVKAEPKQAVTFTGMEARDQVLPVSLSRNIMTAPEEEELSFTSYDWQSNMGARNFTAVWPDGFAVMCYTQATESSFGDRGTGLAIWDPAVGEWEYTEARVEGIKTGFGSIARYKENGLVVAAHSATECHIFFCEDFRNGSRDFSDYVTLPNDMEPTWPVIQCSGANLDIVHVLATQYSATTPYSSALRYYRYENGAFTAQDVIIPYLDETNVSDGGSNITYFMLYDPAKPNRVSFILNNAWSDGKLVISEDNGATWGERVFFQHPGINDTYESWFFYPRWTGAEFDANDNLHIVYEYNGTTGEPGSGSYYPAIGGIGYWSEILPKNELCIGGIGAVGGPFIMDTTYIMEDLYQSEWYWSDALHDPLPEYIGELELIDALGNVVPRDGEGYWPNSELWGEHGAYNGGKAAFASMHMDGNRIFAFWSQIAGDSESMYFDGTSHFLRIFCNMSDDGGQTWYGTKQVLTDIINMYDEMTYGQLIPYLYSDNEGEYLWYCYQNDGAPGTYVQSDEEDYSDNFYRAVKVYLNYMMDDVEENPMTVAPMINIFPNPANGSFNVTLNNESNVNIYNTVGQLVKTYNNVTEVSVNLESGVYFVNAGNQTVKVVVK